MHGRVIDDETKEPIANVTIIIDQTEYRISDEKGNFTFDVITQGIHEIDFQHIAYERRVIKFHWPGAASPLIVELLPASFELDPVLVEGERILPAMPVSPISISREDLMASPGNIANDPFRTLQSQPSCATDGIDFLSQMAIRGGDAEEHRVYFDGYPIKHYAHAGGYTGIVYDDMLASTDLLAGATPLRYKGTLSGAMLMTPASTDSAFSSFRYDITSFAGGLSRMTSSSFGYQLSAKANYFSLPIYQQVGVKERWFKDFMGRAVFPNSDALSVEYTLLLATDSETGVGQGGTQSEREVRSALAGIRIKYLAGDWTFNLRPSLTFYESSDALSWEGLDRVHKLRDSMLNADLTRRSTHLNFGISGEFGESRHDGHGGNWSDHPYSVSTDLRASAGNLASLALGYGISREPWTAGPEPEIYASIKLTPDEIITVSAGYRRSHQSPFLFSQKRSFASIPIDSGDLLAAYSRSWQDAPAVRMDQASVQVKLDLPFQSRVEYNGFWREYDHLLTWDWPDFPRFDAVGSTGKGRGHGYEIILARDDPKYLSVFLAFAQARVWKREGTLQAEKVGDFDRPTSWQLGISTKLLKGLQLSIRWMETRGRPYTHYDNQSTAPSMDQINASRLPDSRRLDAKLLYRMLNGSSDVAFFIDVINIGNRDNIATRYALEVEPDTFKSLPYGGTRFFPILGVTVRW